MLIQNHSFSLILESIICSLVVTIELKKHLWIGHTWEVLRLLTFYHCYFDFNTTNGKSSAGQNWIQGVTMTHLENKIWIQFFPVILFCSALVSRKSNKMKILKERTSWEIIRTGPDRRDGVTEGTTADSTALKLHLDLGWRCLSSLRFYYLIQLVNYNIELCA